MIDLEPLQYPIGRFKNPSTISKEELAIAIDQIEVFPNKLNALVQNLSDHSLQATYRPNGWTIAQVIHHCADSHMNSYMRFKWALTEDKPTIKPYFEERWAELPDGKWTNVAASCQIIEGLHCKWVYLLRALSSQQLQQSFVHPQHGREISLEENIAFYGWHCEHHLAHITIAINSLT